MPLFFTVLEFPGLESAPSETFEPLICSIKGSSSGSSGISGTLLSLDKVDVNSDADGEGWSK